MVAPAREELTGSAARLLFRGGTADATSRTALGYVQANLVAVSRDWAYDALVSAQRNLHACQLLEVVDTGVTPACAADANLRTDCPRYQVWTDGVLVGE